MLPFLSSGDVIIDGGNSDFHDTERRVKELEKKGIYFVGTGISGGEEGALHGPSVMPGGSVEAWPLVKDILQGISAKLDDGSPCCEWIGAGAVSYTHLTRCSNIWKCPSILLKESRNFLKISLSSFIKPAF